jgi:hypothetical protein
MMLARAVGSVTSTTSFHRNLSLQGHTGAHRGTVTPNFSYRHDFWTPARLAWCPPVVSRLHSGVDMFVTGADTLTTDGAHHPYLQLCDFDAGMQAGQPK